jgi:quinol monooxygenase YgiN
MSYLSPLSLAFNCQKQRILENRNCTLPVAGTGFAPYAGTFSKFGEMKSPLISCNLTNAFGVSKMSRNHSDDVTGEVISTATVTVRPEKRMELCLTINSLMNLIRSERGCRAFKFYGEVGDQNSFSLVGEWETREAWDHHLTSDNFAVLIGSLRLLSNRSEVNFKVLAHAPAIEAITRARVTH